MSNNVTEKKWWQSAVVYQITQKVFRTVMEMESVI